MALCRRTNEVWVRMMGLGEDDEDEFRMTDLPQNSRRARIGRQYMVVYRSSFQVS